MGSVSKSCSVMGSVYVVNHVVVKELPQFPDFNNVVDHVSNQDLKMMEALSQWEYSSTAFTNGTNIFLFCFVMYLIFNQL